jgi:hypothetical protein
MIRPPKEKRLFQPNRGPAPHLPMTLPGQAAKRKMFTATGRSS